MKSKPQKQTAKDSERRIPHGRDEVKKSILDAAEKLLAQKGPSEVTIRQIAEAANVKHPLIYRHFGTKDKLILETHERGISKIADNILQVENIEGNTGEFFDAIKNNRWRQIALARAMIDGVDPHLIQNEFPVMRRIVELLKKREETSGKNNRYGAEFSAAALAALALGWMIYEPFLLAATGLENEDKDELHQKVVAILEDMVSKIY